MGGGVMPEPVYPLPRPEEDPQFTFGLMIDVAKVLTDRGYPPVTAGADVVRLQQALFGFLYGTAEEAGR